MPVFILHRATAHDCLNNRMSDKATLYIHTHHMEMEKDERCVRRPKMPVKCHVLCLKCVKMREGCFAAKAHTHRKDMERERNQMSMCQCTGKNATAEMLDEEPETPTVPSFLQE